MFKWMIDEENALKKHCPWSLVPCPWSHVPCPLSPVNDQYSLIIDHWSLIIYNFHRFPVNFHRFPSISINWSISIDFQSVLTVYGHFQKSNFSTPASYLAPRTFPWDSTSEGYVEELENVFSLINDHWSMIIYNFHKSFWKYTSSRWLVDAGGSGGAEPPSKVGGAAGRSPQLSSLIWPLEIIKSSGATPLDLINLVLSVNFYNH